MKAFLTLITVPLLFTGCGSGDFNDDEEFLDPLEVIIEDAGFDQATLDAIAAAEDRFEALFTKNLPEEEFDGIPNYNQIRIIVRHDDSISSSQNASISERRSDGTALEGIIRIRDLNNDSSAREAVTTHEFAHVIVGGGFDDQPYCTTDGWTGPSALAAYKERIDATATAVPTQASASGTKGCGHWSDEWAYTFAKPCSYGAGPAPDILNPAIGSAAVIGPITVGLILDNSPTLPIDLERAEPYPTPGTCD
jgi:hypothetical protein